MRLPPFLYMTQWKPPSLVQPEDAYRSSIDAWLLAGFALRFAPQRFLDLGCGSGPIAYALARALPASRGVAIELDDRLAACARQNLHGLPVTVLRGDLRTYPWSAAVYDAIVCNPPYFELGRGKLSQNPERARARHCLNGDLVDFARASISALRTGGHFFSVLPEPVFARLLARLKLEGLHLRHQLRVRAFFDRGDILLCSAFHIQPGPLVAEELVLYKGHRNYTQAAMSLLAPFSEPVSMDTNRALGTCPRES